MKKKKPQQSQSLLSRLGSRPDLRIDAFETRGSLAGLMLLAFCIAIAIRSIWFWQFADVADARFSDVYLLTNNDGYSFAVQAKAILEGGTIANATAVSLLLSAIAGTLSISLDSLMVILPVILGATAVIPTILVGRALGSTWVGFLAGVFCATMPALFARSIPGHIDTDMLNVTLPLLSLWAILRFLDEPNRHWATAAGLFSALALFWFSSINVLLIAQLGVLGIYLMVRRELFRHENLLLILALALPLVVTSFLPAIALIAIMWGAWPGLARLDVRWLLGAVGLAAIGFMFSPAADLIFQQIKFYVARTAVDGAEEAATSIAFYDVQQSITELVDYGWSVAAINLGGSITGFLIALAGYVKFAQVRPLLLLGLPFLVLGLAGFAFGLRFNLFAAPMLGLGLGYLCTFLPALLTSTRLRGPVSGALCAIAIAPAFVIAIENPEPPVIPGATVEALVESGERTTQDALMFGWWDYGYPIQYFAETDTFVDGGTLFNAPRMFLLSHVLVCADQREAHAVLAAIGTRLSTPEPNLGADELVQRITSGETIERSEPDRDVLLLSNRKLMTILPVVSRFCRANLETGVAPADPLGSYYEDFRDQGSAIAAAYEQFRSTGDRPRLESGGHNIARVIFLDQEDAGAPRRTEWRLRPGGNVLVIRKQEGDALLIDDSLLESAAVQIYFMKNADERLFEILAATKTATVVRLR